MTIDDDIAYFNRGLKSVFQDKSVTRQEGQPIREAVECTRWQARRTRRTQSDTASMVMDYPHHEGDRQWLIETLIRLPLNKREPVMMKYAQLYTQTLQQVQDDNRKQGDARRASNTWLVELMDKQAL